MLSMDKVVVFRQKSLLSGEVFIRAKWLYLGKNCCNRAKWLYLAKVDFFGQSGCIRALVGCIRARWLYLGKVVVFSQKLL